MNTPEQARDIIAVMDRKQVPKILFEPWFAEKIANSWVETPLKAVATDPVADYIVRNYRFCEALASPDSWRFHYMVRKDMKCP